MTDNTSKDKIDAMKKDIAETLNLGITENAIVDNKLEFKVGEVQYRVHKPTVGERTEASKYQSKKFVELLKDKSVLMEADIIKQYKDKGIDIEEFDKTAKNLEKEKQDIQEKLGKALADKAPEVDLEVYKKQIASLLFNIQDVLTRKNALLQYSLETQLFNETFSYFVMLVTEVKKGEEWVRLWNSLEEMNNADSQFFNQVVFYSTFVLRGEIGNNN